MVNESQRDELAAKLLERHLVTNRDEALELATKFLEMEVSESQMPELAVAGDALESAPAAASAYASVLYYENLKLEPSGTDAFERAAIEEEAPAAQPAPQAPLQQARREQPNIDLNAMFHVDNLRKHAQES